MTTNELQDLLYEAQEHLNEAISLLQTYVRQTGDHEAEAYIVDHLKIFAGRDHGFLAGDLNIDDLMERLDDHDEDEEDDDDEEDTAGRPFYWSNQLHCYVAIPDNE